MVHAPTGTCFNRHGELLSIRDQFKPALELLREKAERSPFDWFDCEGLERRHNIGRGTLIILDLPVQAKIYLARRDDMAEELQVEMLRFDSKPKPDSLYILPNWPSAQIVWDMALEANRHFGCEFYEGVVAKRADSEYPFQLRSPEQEFAGWLKHRWKF